MNKGREAGDELNKIKHENNNHQIPQAKPLLVPSKKGDKRYYLIRELRKENQLGEPTLINLDLASDNESNNPISNHV